jgi:hypothetical protein
LMMGGMLMLKQSRCGVRRGYVSCHGILEF